MPRTLRPAVAASALALAALAWGAATLRNRTSPARAQIDAGVRYAAQGNGRAAERAWYEAIRLDPNDPDPWELLAGLYQSTERNLAVAMALQQVQRLRPSSPHLRARLAEALYKTGDEARALRLAREEIAAEPNCALALKVAADALKSGGDAKLLLDYARRLTEIEPDNVTYLLFYADALTVRGRHAEAAPLLAQVLARTPQNANAYGMRGAARFETDPTPAGLKAAEADFIQSLRCNPAFPLPRLYLGKLYRRQGRFPEAILQLEEAARRMGGAPEVHYELAAAYRQARRPADAARALRVFEDLRKRRDEESRLKVRAVAEPRNATLHHDIGMRLFRRGDLHHAGAYLKTALTLDPANAEARAALEQILERDGVGDPKAVLETILRQVQEKS